MSILLSLTLTLNSNLTGVCVSSIGSCHFIYKQKMTPIYFILKLHFFSQIIYI